VGEQPHRPVFLPTDASGDAMGPAPSSSVTGILHGSCWRASLRAGPSAIRREVARRRQLEGVRLVESDT
jgi:hypothetical protein